LHEKSDEIKALENEILKHQQLYYNGTPEISDAEFDALWDRLSVLDPLNPVLKRIGTDRQKEFQKSKHIIMMGSQQKASNVPEFEKWAKKMNFPFYLVQYKCDGISLELQYENGILKKAVTRGDGITGDDITSNATKMKGCIKKLSNIAIPKKVSSPMTTLDGFSVQVTKISPPSNTLSVPFTGGIRGEILMSHAIFQAKYSDSANCRNIAAGISKRLDGKGSEDLFIMVYDAVAIDESPFQDELGKLAWMKKQGFNVVECKKCPAIQDVIAYWKETAEKRDTLDFDIDGLVVKGNEIDLEDMQRERPMKQTAFKFPVQEVISTLLGVEWSESGMYYTPVALITPVEIGGSTIKRASLANPNLIKELKLKIGDSVVISKRGDIIPKIESVSFSPPDAKPIELPVKCSTCGSLLINEGTHLYCPNPACPKKEFRRIEKWIEKLNVKDFGGVLLGKLFETKKIQKIADLYKLTVEDLTTLERIGEKTAKTALDNLRTVKEISLAKFASGFDIDGIGEGFLEKVVKTGINDLDALKNTPISQLSKVEGIGEITAKAIHDGINDLYPEMMDVLKTKAIRIWTPVKGGKLSGMSVCFTGALTIKRADAEQLVVDNGGTVKGSVVRGLTYLVTNDTGSGSAKNMKAKELGVKIISEEEFRKLLE
jgi:DNA ligase (NAD+)